MGATIVGGAANLAAESFRRLAEEELLVTFDRLAVERSVALFLLVESLKKGRDRLEGRVLQRFAAEDVLFAVALVVRHVVPLERERFGRLREVPGRKQLGDAQHFFESLRVEPRGGHEILREAIIAARLHINILQVAGLFVVERFFDEKRDGAIEIIFRLAVAGRLFVERLWKVLREHFLPCGTVGIPQNIFELQKCFGPAPIQAGTSLVELWESSIKKKLHPKSSAVDADFCFHRLIRATTLELVLLR